MMTTFENADRQSRRKYDREKHMKAIEDIINSSDFLTPAPYPDSMEEATAAAVVDALGGQPLAKVPQDPKESLLNSPRKKSIQKLLPIACVAFFAVVVLVSLASTGKRLKKDIIQGPKTPQADLELETRFKHLFSQVLDWGVTNRSTLEDETSAAFQALHWLAYEDVDTDHVENLRTRYSLATLYYSTYRNASAWTSSRFWLSSYTVCYWHGIECHGNNDGAQVSLVQSVNLSSNNLHGFLPAEISLLQRDCLVLDLSFNHITGHIPDEIGKAMVNLQHIYLGPNLLTGLIPGMLFELSHLTHLYLDGCGQLSGTLPNSIGQLSKLQGLGLHENLISGTIPASIGELTDLRVLNLDFNAFVGRIPKEMGELVGLVDLRLNSNLFSGPIPSELSNLRMLEVFYLGDNRLSGRLDNIDFEKMPLLGDIQMQKNELSGTIPEPVGYLALLQILYLDGNFLTGPIPPIANDLFLEEVYLSKNKLSGPIPPLQLRRLKKFNLNENNLDGPIPSFDGLLELEILSLNNNSLQGQVPTQIGTLPFLKEAYFHGNAAIAGDVPLCKSPSTPFLQKLTSDCHRDDVTCSCCTFCFA